MLLLAVFSLLLGLSWVQADPCPSSLYLPFSLYTDSMGEQAVVKIKYGQNYHNFVFILRMCICWPIWQVWKIFAGPQQVPGDIWSPGAAGGGPLIGGPACHSQHHAGLKNMITLIFLICTTDLSRKLRIHSMMKMMFASVGGGVDSQIWMMMVSWVGLFSLYISLNLHIVTCQGSGNGRREGEQTSRSGMTLQCQTFRTITACSSSPQLAMVD